MNKYLKNIHVKFPIVLFIILFFSNLLLLKLPLFGTLGYEFSVVNAVLLFLFGGLYTIYALSRTPQKKSSFNIVLVNNPTVFTTFVSIPFVIGLISSILFFKCPLVEGILFYFIITVPAYILGIAVASYSFELSGKFSYLFFVLSFVIAIILPLGELYYNPQVYFYNPIVGYFPGTIYDEGIRIDKFLVAYRIFNLSFAVTIILLSKWIHKKKVLTKLLSLLVITLIALTFSYLKPYLHFSTNKEILNYHLNSTTSTDNFIIHSNNKSLHAREKQYVALQHEYCLDQVKTQLNIPFHYSIDSYIFKDKVEKLELMGAGNANVAKPWLRQIYLNYNSFEETLKHELVHVVASGFGATPLKVADNFNSAMIEGLAVAIDNNYDGWHAHYLAKLAWSCGYRISIPTLYTGMNFFSQTSSVSYIYSGSFMKYLIDEFGIERVKQLYSNTDFKKYLGKGVEQLSEDYYKFLDGHQINFNKYQAQLYFGSKPIFKKYCPRFAETQTREALSYFQKNKLDDALKLFQKVYGYSNSYASLIGVVRTMSKQKKYDQAAEYLKNEISKFNKDQNYFILELTLGDLLAESNQIQNAAAEYDSLLYQNPHVDYSNEVLLRQAFLLQGSDSLKAFLNSSDTMNLTKLVRLNEKEIRYFSITRLIHLAENLHEDISPFLVGLKQKLNVRDYESCYAALQISKYFLKRMDLENAQFFAIQAVQTNLDEDAKHIFLENLRMVNWFKNFSSETKVD